MNEQLEHNPSSTPVEVEEKEPPIKRGEVFVPEEELDALYVIPKTERKFKIRKIKERLAYQKEGLAKVQARMIEEIHANPEITTAELMFIIKYVGDTYGLNPDQLAIAERLVNEYEKKHQNVKEFRREHPDDIELFTKLFGRSPKGHVEVIEGPMTLFIRCQNMDDYTYIHSDKFSTNEDITKEDRIAASLTGGVSLSKSLVPGLEGTIIAEAPVESGFFMTREKLLPKRLSDKIYKHEEQHAIKIVFGDMVAKSEVEFRFENSKSDEEKELALEGFLKRVQRYKIEERHRDEILAYFKVDDRNAEQIYSVLGRSRSDGGIYDYMAAVKHHYIKEFSGFPESQRELANRVIERFFDETKHRKLLKDSIYSFERLTVSGYTIDDAIAVLIHEPLHRWKKVVTRLVASKK